MRGGDLYSEFLQWVFKWENENPNEELQKNSTFGRNKSNYGLDIIPLSEATPSSIFFKLVLAR